VCVCVCVWGGGGGLGGGKGGGGGGLGGGTRVARMLWELGHVLSDGELANFCYVNRASDFLNICLTRALG
jgi:hypothetical protein